MKLKRRDIWWPLMEVYVCTYQVHIKWNWHPEAILLKAASVAGVSGEVLCHRVGMNDDSGLWTEIYGVWGRSRSQIECYIPILSGSIEEYKATQFHILEFPWPVSNLKIFFTDWDSYGFLSFSKTILRQYLKIDRSWSFPWKLCPIYNSH
jgi:hypothetical protein